MRKLALGTIALGLVACFSDDNAVGGLDGGQTKMDATTGPDGTAPSDAGDAGDASTIPDAPSDVAMDTAPPPACDLTKPFGAPTLVDYPLTLDDYAARLSADRLSMYLMSNRNGYFQIFTLGRGTISSPFANAMLLANVNFGNANTSKATVTANGLTLYEESDTDQDAGQGAAARLYVSTRATVGGTFGAPALLDLGGSNSDFAPFVTPDGTTLYFSSDRGGTLDAYVVTKGDAGTFGTPVALSALDSAGQITLNLLPSADELTIYFTSSRTGTGAKGNNDVWVAHRASKSVAFGAPTNVTELNTALNDEPTWLSADGCTIWYASSGTPADAGPSDGRAHIYQATKGP